MAATGNCLGGEQSGHIIFSKHATTGDGILTSLKVMEVILEKKQTLAKLASEYEVYPQVLKNVKVKDKKQPRMMKSPGRGCQSNRKLRKQWTYPSSSVWYRTGCPCYGRGI